MTADPMLVDAARRVFRNLASSPQLADAVWNDALWEVLDQTGFLQVGVPESTGGEGGTIDDAALLLGLAGEYALPIPLAETALVAGWLHEEAGLRLPRPSDGPVTVAPGSHRDTLCAHRSTEDWALSGLAHRVPWAGASSHVVALIPIAGEDGGNLVIRLSRSDYDVVAGRNLAGERRDTVIVDHTILGQDDACVVTFGPQALKRRGAVTRSILIAGALRRTLELTVRYATTRVQFGRPIASFQAVGHLLARLAEQAASAEIAAELGLRSWRNDAAEAGIAKSVCGRAAGEGARLAHQVHGAIGVTEEYELQRLSRRLLSWRDEYGSETEWERAIGTNILTPQGSDAAWDIVIGTQASLPAPASA